MTSGRVWDSLHVYSGWSVLVEHYCELWKGLLRTTCVLFLPENVGRLLSIRVNNGYRETTEIFMLGTCRSCSIKHSVGRSIFNQEHNIECVFFLHLIQFSKKKFAIFSRPRIKCGLPSGCCFPWWFIYSFSEGESRHRPRGLLLFGKGKWRNIYVRVFSWT